MEWGKQAELSKKDKMEGGLRPEYVKHRARPRRGGRKSKIFFSPGENMRVFTGFLCIFIIIYIYRHCLQTHVELNVRLYRISWEIRAPGRYQ